jgi:predicted RNA-binding Zn ribbon-like protein
MSLRIPDRRSDTAAILTIKDVLGSKTLTSAPEPQPGGRAPAPGDLALVQAFINSNYSLGEGDHGAELLGSPEALNQWLRRRDLIEPGVEIGPDDLREALLLREGLRALLVAKRGEPDADALDQMNAIAPGRPVTVRLQPQGPDFQAGDPLGLILALTAKAMLDGSWTRLKACRECCWAFYDHSRNGAGSWCSMKVCGGRVKQRAYYRRTQS